MSIKMSGQNSQPTSPVAADEREYDVMEHLVWLHRDIIDYPGRSIEQHLDHFYPPQDLAVDQRASQWTNDWPNRLPQLVDNTLVIGLDTRPAANQSKDLWDDEIRSLWPDRAGSEHLGAAGGDSSAASESESQAEIGTADGAGLAAEATAEASTTNAGASTALLPVAPALLAPPTRPVQRGSWVSFKPTTMAQFGPGRLQPQTAQEQALRRMTGMSPNYNGDVHNVYNHSLNSLPDDQNCSFWLSKLHPDVEVHEITDQITSCGRLTVVQITRAQANRWGAGAKVTFFDVDAAQDFHRRFVLFEELDDPLYTGGLAGHIIIRGRRASVVRNNVKVAQNSAPEHHSRVIRITGPRWYVQEKTILEVLRGKFVYELERIIDHSIGDKGDLEFRFARYQEQAKFATLCLLTELEENPQLPRSLRQTVTVRYWRDPCDRGA